MTDLEHDEQMQEVENALFIVTSNDKLGVSGEKTGFHLSELTHAYYELKKYGFQIDFASPKGGVAPIDPSSYDLQDELNNKFCREDNLITRLEKTTKLSDVETGKYSVVYFPGGHGTMWDLPNNKDIERIVNAIYQKGGIIAAVCHGPAAFVGLKLEDGSYLVENKTVNCFTNSEEEETGKADLMPFLLESKLKEQGANFTSVSNGNSCAVEDQRLITGQNPASVKELAKKIITIFNSVKKILIKL